MGLPETGLQFLINAVVLGHLVTRMVLGFVFYVPRFYLQQLVAFYTLMLVRLDIITVFPLFLQFAIYLLLLL